MELVKTLVPIAFLLGTQEEQDVTQTQLVQLGFTFQRSHGSRKRGKDEKDGWDMFSKTRILGADSEEMSSSPQHLH